MRWFIPKASQWSVTRVKTKTTQSRVCCQGGIRFLYPCTPLGVKQEVETGDETRSDITRKLPKPQIAAIIHFFFSISLAMIPEPHSPDPHNVTGCPLPRHRVCSPERSQGDGQRFRARYQNGIQSLLCHVPLCATGELYKHHEHSFLSSQMGAV